MSRRERQARFAPLGAEGQAAIEQAAAVVVGCGALGSVTADMLARAGVAKLRLIDRDVVEAANLHRQALFVDDDARRALPKAEAAAAHLRAVRPDLEVEPIVADVDGATVLDLLAGADVVFDGTDNFEARHLLNEACLETGQPWVHAACLGSQAVAWPIVPGRGACFACLVPDVPAPGEVETCDTAGVIGPAVHAAASLQVAEGLKLLARRGEVATGPCSLDTWRGTWARVEARQDPQCRACVRGERRFLGHARRADVVACGRSGVQVRWTSGPIALDRVAGDLAVQSVTRNRFLVRFHADGHDLTVFRDGRVLVSGTRDPARARAIAARWLGG